MEIVKTKTSSEGLVDFNWDEVSNNSIPKYSSILKNADKYSNFLSSKVSQYESSRSIDQISKNSIISGKVTMISERYVTIDINNKDNIVIERRGVEEKICKQLSVGQIVDVLITDITDKPYQIKGSLAEIIKLKANNTMIESYKNNLVIDATVNEMIPAGYLMSVNVDGITIDAFMPNTLADANKLYDPTSIIGKNVKVMLETLQQDKGIYVVSRKKYLQSLIPEKIKELRNAPKDKIYVGRVTGTKDFGIFMQFNDCLTGMIHKANLQKEYQDMIGDFKPGDKIEFFVKDIIKGGSQIILTQKLDDSLWDNIRVGDVIDGKILTVKPFGALVSLDYETNGLIQTSFLSKYNKSLKKDDNISVLVIKIMRDERKIFLTFADDTEMIEKLRENNSNDLEKLKQKYNSK